MTTMTIVKSDTILSDDLHPAGQRAGDLVILPVGWTGRWDVLETVRKIYAIY